MGLALDCQASGTPSGSGRQRTWGHRPLPTGLWSPSVGGATSQLLCQMAFDSNIDVNGIWIMTLFVFRGFITVHHGAVLEGGIPFSYLCVSVARV